MPRQGHVRTSFDMRSLKNRNNLLHSREFRSMGVAYGYDLLIKPRFSPRSSLFYLCRGIFGRRLGVQVCFVVTLRKQRRHHSGARGVVCGLMAF